jgi:signal transduction histidine kinase
VRDDFLATAGHELRTPLSVMLMQLQSLQRVLRQDPTVSVTDRLDKAERSGRRLEKLISQLLDVSRIAAGRLSLEAEPFDLAQLVREVVTRFSEAGTTARSPIVVRADAAVHGSWDRNRIDQVITNLISNAVKYGKEQPVEVELWADAESAHLRVTDHGIGIDDEHQTKIFQKFERAVNTREFGGMGLGLWITRQIVEASGGSIEVKSVVGQGATFSIRLPVRFKDGSHVAH